MGKGVVLLHYDISIGMGWEYQASGVDRSQEESPDSSFICWCHFDYFLKAMSCCHLQYPGSLVTGGNNYWEQSVKRAGSVQDRISDNRSSQNLVGTGSCKSELRMIGFHLPSSVSMKFCPKIIVNVDMVSLFVLSCSMMLTVYCWT